MADDVYDIDDDDRLRVRVHAVPGPGRAEVVGRQGDGLKVRVAVPAIQPKADEQIAGLLADAFGVEPTAVALSSGAGGRAKTFTVEGVDEPTAKAVIDRILAEAGTHGPRRRR